MLANGTVVPQTFTDCDDYQPTTTTTTTLTRNSATTTTSTTSMDQSLQAENDTNTSNETTTPVVTTTLARIRYVSFGDRCSSCPPGTTFHKGTGGHDPDSCRACPVGKQNPDGDPYANATCNPCPEGTYAAAVATSL